MSETIGMKDYVDTRINDIKEAVVIATRALDKRLDGMNEFRDTLKDQAGRFVTREEMSLIVSRLEEDIKNLNITRSEMLTSKEYDAAHKDLENQVDELRIKGATLEGKASEGSVRVVGARAQLGVVFGAVATAIAVFNFISRFLNQ